MSVSFCLFHTLHFKFLLSLFSLFFTFRKKLLFVSLAP